MQENKCALCGKDLGEEKCSYINEDDIGLFICPECNLALLDELSSGKGEDDE